MKGRQKCSELYIYALCTVCACTIAWIVVVLQVVLKRVSQSREPKSKIEKYKWQKEEKQERNAAEEKPAHKHTVWSNSVRSAHGALYMVHMLYNAHCTWCIVDNSRGVSSLPITFSPPTSLFTSHTFLSSSSTSSPSLPLPSSSSSSSKLSDWGTSHN